MARPKKITPPSDEVFFEPDNLDRDEMIEKTDTSDHLWCLHCERAYQRGKFRKGHDLQLCPYPGCDGDTIMDAWDWAKIRDVHPEYPTFPEDGASYPLYT